VTDFCILISNNIFYEGESPEALGAVLKEFGPYTVDVFSQPPYVRLWPVEVEQDLPIKRWVYKNGAIGFVDNKQRLLFPYEVC